jgi:hypothetical protein
MVGGPCVERGSDDARFSPARKRGLGARSGRATAVTEWVFGESRLFARHSRSRAEEERKFVACASGADK